MKFNRHIPEQLIIDYALGSLEDNDKQEEIRDHLRECTSCYEVMESWQHMLAGQPESQVQPSNELKEALRQEVVRQTEPVRRKRKRPALVFAVSSLAVILLLYIGLTNLNYSDDPSFEMVQHEDIPGVMMQSDPETIEKSIIPVADFDQVSGMMWMNNINQEIMLEVDGLENIGNRDYQLWIVDHDDNLEGEVLLIDDGVSRVFIKGKDVEHFQWIKASLEPAGGSEIPTGPDTFIVPVDFGN